MKRASFSVNASEPQALRWRRAAEADGHRAVGTWLAEAADAFLKARARAGRPIPLAWHLGTFHVALADGTAVQVRGMISPPFATFQGSGKGPNGNKQRTLIYIPSGQVIATLRSARQAKALASELAPVYARDDAAVVGVTERHRREAK